MVHVVLVDQADNPIGTMEKMEAHQKGLLHRAFSVLLFNSKKELLLQKRAAGKYHSAGLWTNTCCSHPLPGEDMKGATRRTLQHEMGIDLQPEFLYKFLYRVSLNDNLMEHEYDHVYTGCFDGLPHVNPDEVEDWKFVDVPALQIDVENNPENYSSWFRLIVNHPEFQKMI